MQDPGTLIATYFILLYTILGPLVLLAIYVLFDALATSDEPRRKQQKRSSDKKETALWTKDDILAHMNRL